MGASRVSALPPIDLAIIIVKASDTVSAIKANLNIIGDETFVMTLQNGGGNDRIIARYVPMERVVIGTTKHNSVNLDNGNVRHSGSGDTCIGSNVADVDLSDIVQVFEEAGLKTVVSDDIQHIIWSKLFVNLSINTFTAITKAPIGSMIESGQAWFFAEKLVCEAIDVAEAEGQHFSYLEVLSSLHATCEAVASGFSSMSQDVMNCRKTEVDAINGYVVERAAIHNVPTPYKALIRNLILAIEGTYKEQVKPMVRYVEGDVVIEQGDVSPCIYKVMQGRVLLSMNREQQDEYFIGIYGEGKCFGIYSCLAGMPSRYSAVAEGDVVIMQIPKNEIHNYISINPKNAGMMMTALANQMALMFKHIELLNEDLSDALNRR